MGMYIVTEYYRSLKRNFFIKFNLYNSISGRQIEISYGRELFDKEKSIYFN